MTGDGAYKLIIDSLAAYRDEHKTMPARVVIHKTPGFDNDEIEAHQRHRRVGAWRALQRDEYRSTRICKRPSRYAGIHP